MKTADQSKAWREETTHLCSECLVVRIVKWQTRCIRCVLKG